MKTEDGSSPRPTRSRADCRRALCRLLPFILSILLTGCATNAVTGKREFRLVSEDREIAIGRESYIQQQQAQGGPYVTDPDLVRYVSDIGYKLAAVSDRPHLPYEFVILNNAVPNAWALPGGKIAINRGLLTELQSEAELAAVIGHEIVHVAAGHGANSLERGMVLQVGLYGLGIAVDDHDYRDFIMAGAGVGSMLVNTKYGRRAELESDAYGMKYMAAAGYDPSAAVDLQATFLRLADGKDPHWLNGLFASHPPSRERMEKNAENASGYPFGGFRGESQYRDAIAGLVRAEPAYEALEEGYAALTKKAFGDALKHARTGIAIAPQEAHLHNLAAKALSMQNRHAEAREPADQSIRLNPDYFDFYLVRAGIRKATGDRVGARQDLERSNTLLPTAAAHRQLGEMAAENGRRDEAVRHYRVAAQAESPDGIQAFASLAMLDMRENPQLYLKPGYELDRRGLLTVTVENRTPITVNSCRFSVYSPLTRRWSAHRLPGPLPPRSKMRVQTGIGPLIMQEQMQALRIRFEQVLPGSP